MYQFWLGSYHIHHTILSIGLLSIGTLIWYAGYRKKSPVLQCCGVFLIGISAIAFLQWVICYYDECGGLLWITKGR